MIQSTDVSRCISGRRVRQRLRASCTCRARARRPRAWRASPPRWPRALRRPPPPCCATAAGTTTTPSSSATITSPGLTSAPAQTTGMLTEPSVAFTVPLALIARRKHRELHRGQVLHVAHAAVDDEALGAARAKAGRQQVAEEAVGRSRRCRRRRPRRRAESARPPRASSSCRRAAAAR